MDCGCIRHLVNWLHTVIDRCLSSIDNRRNITVSPMSYTHLSCLFTIYMLIIDLLLIKYQSNTRKRWIKLHSNNYCSDLATATINDMNVTWINTLLIIGVVFNGICISCVCGATKQKLFETIDLWGCIEVVWDGGWYEMVGGWVRLHCCVCVQSVWEGVLPNLFFVKRLTLEGAVREWNVGFVGLEGRSIGQRCIVRIWIAGNDHKSTVHKTTVLCVKQQQQYYT